MELLRHIISVCLLATFSANAGEQPTAKANGAADQLIAVELQPLQGTWEGAVVGDKSHKNITITITGNSFHFHRDTNFWFDTTITLPAGTDPKQLHATIKHSASPEDFNGKVVVAIFKIEDGTLTLATDNGSGEALKVFEGAPNRYELRRVQPQKQNAEPPKTK